MLQGFLRGSGDYWPQFAITLGSIGFAAVGILLTPPDEGFSWLVSSVPGRVFLGAAVLTLAGSIVAWKRTPGLLWLRKRVAELETILERAERDYYD